MSRNEYANLRSTLFRSVKVVAFSVILLLHRILQKLPWPASKIAFHQNRKGTKMLDHTYAANIVDKVSHRLKIKMLFNETLQRWAAKGENTLKV